MPLNTGTLYTEIYAAFKKLTTEQDANTPGGNREKDLAKDLSRAIYQYAISGPVPMTWIGGVGTILKQTTNTTTGAMQSSAVPPAPAFPYTGATPSTPFPSAPIGGGGGGSGGGGGESTGGNEETGAPIKNDIVSDKPTKVTPGGTYNEATLLKALDDAGILDKIERAMFVSQMAHESGNFHYKEEIHDGSNYEKRKDLHGDNMKPGDGKKYKGRGFIQLTGRANYAKYGKLVGQPLEADPLLAKDPAIAAAVAIKYWEKRVDQKAARAGNVERVTKNINGGQNGLADRKKKFQQYKAKYA